MSRSNENEPGTFLYLDDRIVPVLETLDGFVLKVLLLIARETYLRRYPSYQDLEDLTGKSRSTVCRATTNLAMRGFIVPCAVPCEGGALRTWRYLDPRSRQEVEPEGYRPGFGRSDRATERHREVLEPHGADEVEHANDDTPGVMDAPQGRGSDVPTVTGDGRIEEEKNNDGNTSTTASPTPRRSGAYATGLHAYEDGACAYFEDSSIVIEFDSKPTENVREGLLGLGFRYVRLQGERSGRWRCGLSSASATVALAIWRHESQEVNPRDVGARRPSFDPVRWAATNLSCGEGELRGAVGCIRDLGPAEADARVASAVLRLRACSRTV